MKRGLVAVASLALVVACSSIESDDVPWSEYAPEFRENVESAIESGDCSQMDEQFWLASDGSDAHRARFGEGNGKLMDYIDDAMSEAGCNN